MAILTNAAITPSVPGMVITQVLHIGQVILADV